ncbi:hypothetical protein BC828DRAFT_388937 [Blastocladiella britannica]|nr:hypothetical protein BC828DRAFT_388937 [Blastocladiella britannica]
MTMIADILLRFGYGTITICRFWRLKLIAPLQPTRSTLIFRVASVFVIIVSIVSLYSSIALHVTELAYAQDGVVVSTSTIPTVIFFREQDRALQFVTFMFVHVLNLACDATFVMTIIKSMKLSRQKETFTTREIVMTIAPYIPPALFTILYMMTSVITIAKIQIPVIGTFVVTTSIALSRIAPVVETFFFYAFAINHTRMLLKNTSRGGSNSHSRGQITTSGGGRSGGQTTAAYSGYTSQVALSQIKPLDSFSPSEKASSRGYAAKGPLPPSTATFADQPYSLAATPAVGISHNPAPASYGQHQPQWSSGRTFADPDPTPAAPVRYTSRGAMESNGYGPSPSQIQPHYEVPLSDPSQSPPMASGGSLDRQWSVALAKANGRF